MQNRLMRTFVLLLVVGCASGKAPAPYDHAARFAAARATHEAAGQRFAVASQGEATSKAALEIARVGGNVIDAMAAASFVISVERPHSTGLGGGGFLLYRRASDRKVFAFDFREKAPKSATRDMFLDAKGEPVAERSQYGGLSSGVPGLVAGVIEAHRRFGKLPLARVMEAAIRLADEGLIVYPELENAIADSAEKLKLDPLAKRLFFDARGAPLKAGALLVQKELARSLRLIAKDGAAAFYKGPIATALVAHQKRIGGLITLGDLAAYEVKERAPVTQTVLDVQVHSMPPPSSGGTHVVQILKILELLKLDPQTPYAPENVALTAAAMQRAFYDRAQYLGDSDFVPVPVKGLSSTNYNQRLAQEILKTGRATPSPDLKNPDPYNFESSQTTHFSLMDHDGNVAVTTQTINGWFGAQVMIPGFGIFMNNEMDDFSAKPGALNLYGAVGSTANEIAPEKRPLSSMSPTIIERDGMPLLALGSPSGTRIITCVAMTAFNRLHYQMDLYSAQSALRYHHQYIPDELRVEAPGLLPKGAQSALEKYGYAVKEFDLGCRVQAVEREGTQVRAVADPRGQGSALAF